MSQYQPTLRLEVPDSLAEQLRGFRLQVWKEKMIEAMAIAVAAIAVAYLTVFVLDRFVDTPAWIRAGVAITAVATCVIVPYYLHRWVWSYRSPTQLARLLSRKLPRVGDQLLGVLELSESESEQARSWRLCQAAIEQVATDAEHRDFTEATPDSHAKSAVWTATLTVGLGVLLLLCLPLAARNAWARFVAPWSDTPRYTFAAVEPVPHDLVVPHGEEFPLTLQLTEQSAWHPADASLQLTARSLSANQQDGTYRFDVPALIAPTELNVRVGDWSQRIRVEPMLRPELESLNASVVLPKYLERTGTEEMEIRGGGLSLVRGSEVTFTAAATRDLESATVAGEEVSTSGSNFDSPSVKVEEPLELALTWTDEHQLEGKEPFVLSIAADEDLPPTVLCEGLPRKKVVLDTEQLLFQVAVRDDFGVKEVGMTWKGLEGQFVETPADGKRLLATGGPEETAMDVEGTFTASSLGIAPQPVEVQVYATDYLPDRERMYSSKFLLYVLDAEQHAIWVTEQLARWHRQSLEVRDRELRLYETNKQLRDLPPEQLDLAETRRRLESQAAAEQANGRRLSSLTRSGEELLRQAARNPEIGVGHLDRWAEMLQVLSDISANRMPSVADLLKDGAQSPAQASRVASKPRPTVGENRAQGGGGAPQEEKKSAPKPPVPAVVDMESSQQPLDDGEMQEPQKKNPSNPTLRLPTTTLMGKAKKKPPAGQSDAVDQAVEEQKDLLAEFEKVANELNEVLANLEGSTLVKRLKAESRKHNSIAGTVADEISQSFGAGPASTPAEAKTTLASLSKQVDKSGITVSFIMDDMQAYFERRRMVKFKAVLDDMRKEDVLGGLRRLSDDMRSEPGLSMAQSEYWSDTMDRWAEDLVDPSNCGACPGCRAKGSLPPSIVLEVLKILEGEINLREETRVAEQAKGGVEDDVRLEEAIRLAETQTSLADRTADVVDRILELPDAEAEFARELKLLGKVNVVMVEASAILARPETGSPAIAAETEAIELLLQSRRINPNGGGGGGANPGGGGSGDTKDTALALLGAGLNQKEVREAPEIVQSVGTTGKALPEEFRAGLDQYFNELETPTAAP
ncbi:hypothetical protein [Aeoliella sp.]|uniref:hypothetical protein n=1 Tax=Aeoliella sp. TaxID=2795800 RepID=UPI003CCBD228